jgi:RimJ/RimL family protein N-acetyltransferase
MRIRRLCAVSHADHRRSWRVLEKRSVEREGLLKSSEVFARILGCAGILDP